MSHHMDIPAQQAAGQATDVAVSTGANDATMSTGTSAPAGNDAATAQAPGPPFLGSAAPPSDDGNEVDPTSGLPRKRPRLGTSEHPHQDHVPTSFWALMNMRSSAARASSSMRIPGEATAAASTSASASASVEGDSASNQAERDKEEDAYWARQREAQRKRHAEPPKVSCRRTRCVGRRSPSLYLPQTEFSPADDVADVNEMMDRLTEWSERNNVPEQRDDEDAITYFNRLRNFLRNLPDDA